MTYTPYSAGSDPVNIRNYFGGFATMGGIETPSSLPTLTWDFGEPVMLADPTDLDDLMNAIDTAVSASADGWRVLDTKLSTDPSPWNGGASVGILIGGPVGSPVEDCRIVIAASSADGLEAVSLAGSSNNQANSAWVTFSPDAGAAGFDVFGSGGTEVSDGEFLTSGPGAAEAVFKGQRETGLTSLFNTPSTTGVDDISLWSNSEMFLLIPRRGAAPRAVLAGATVVPPSDAAAEPDGRVYGMHVAAPDGTSNRQWLGGNTIVAVGTLKAYVFRPTSPTTPDLVYVSTPANQQDSVNTSQTPSGPQLAWPCVMEQRYSSNEQFGWVRQIGLYSNAIHGDPIVDENGAGIGQIFGDSSTGIDDAWAVVNVGNQG